MDDKQQLGSEQAGPRATPVTPLQSRGHKSNVKVTDILHSRCTKSNISRKMRTAYSLHPTQLSNVSQFFSFLFPSSFCCSSALSSHMLETRRYLLYSKHLILSFWSTHGTTGAASFLCLTAAITDSSTGPLPARSFGAKNPSLSS